MRLRSKNLLKFLVLAVFLTVIYYYFQLQSLKEGKEKNLVRGPHNGNKEDNDVDHIDIGGHEQDFGQEKVDKGEDYARYDAAVKESKTVQPFEWEKRGPSDYEYPRFLQNSLGNYEKDLPEQKRAGAGEYGEAVVLDSSLDSSVKSSIAEFGFNIVASDRISLDRAPKDLRHPQCKHWDYPPHLPTVSVVIVFHNEGWSPLIRTVHSVINGTPKKLLAEIVMIDDGSHKTHLGKPMDEYLQRFNGLVKLYRNERREGLIRARSIGGKKAVGEILVYLDAHCEVEPNWLPPLITPIRNDRRACTVPLIDVIDGNKYTFTEQAGGDHDGFARGAWDWSFMWKRIPLTKREKSRRKHLTEPYRSPAMAGGLFAIDRKYFYEIGLYDDGLEVWGGENFELSYKLWMCGGQLLFVPCSRVGHVYRLPGWRGNPPPSYVPRDAVLRNYKRVIETWWDEYKNYFYQRRPEVQSIDTGDLSEQKALRNRLQCRTFKWFMDTIAYDIPRHYPMVEPPSGASGKLTNIGTGLCLDGKHGGSGAPVFLSDCESNSAELQWWLTWREDIRPGGQTSDKARKVCLDCVGRNNVASFWECHQMQGNQLWKYIFDQKMLMHSVSSSCLEANQGEKKVYAKECDQSNTNQLWVFSEVNVTQLSLFNTDMHNAVLMEEL